MNHESFDSCIQWYVLELFFLCMVVQWICACIIANFQAGTEGKYFPPSEERLHNIWIRSGESTFCPLKVLKSIF